MVRNNYKHPHTLVIFLRYYAMVFTNTRRNMTQDSTVIKQIQQLFMKMKKNFS
jgi:hypothetical protein